MGFHPKTLTNIRRMFGYTYDRVANEIGVGVNQVIMFEAGEIKPVAMEVIALARLFRVKPKYFYAPDVLEGKERKVDPLSISFRR